MAEQILRTRRTSQFVLTLTLRKAAPSRTVGTVMFVQYLVALRSILPRPMLKKLGIEVNPSPGLHLGTWEMKLENDPDKEFLLNGIKYGFDIIDEDVHISSVNCKNHPSAKPNSPLYEKASKQILKEIQAGHYVFCDNPPDIVSPMAANYPSLMVRCG